MIILAAVAAVAFVVVAFLGFGSFNPYYGGYYGMMGSFGGLGMLLMVPVVLVVVAIIGYFLWRGNGGWGIGGGGATVEAVIMGATLRTRAEMTRWRFCGSGILVAR